MQESLSKLLRVYKDPQHNIASCWEIRQSLNTHKYLIIEDSESETLVQLGSSLAFFANSNSHTTYTALAHFGSTMVPAALSSLLRMEGSNHGF